MKVLSRAGCGQARGPSAARLGYVCSQNSGATVIRRPDHSSSASFSRRRSVRRLRGCAKYRYNKLDLGTIGGIPRVLDAGQCNDSYSLAVIALTLKDAFALEDVNDLPIDFDIAWYEQKAVTVLLALLSLGFRNIRIGPTLPAFLSENVAAVLVQTFGLQGTASVDADLAAIAGR